MKFFLLILKNLLRNKLRSLLTALAVIALVAIFSMITTVLGLINGFMAEKDKDVGVMITERYHMMTAFDRSYMEQIVTPGTTINRELSRVPGFHADRYNLWHFGIFSLDPEMKDKDLTLIAVACLPEKIKATTEGLQDFDDRWVDLMRDPPRSRLKSAGIVVGGTQLTRLHKKVGDVFKAKSVMHNKGTGVRQPIEMEFEIVGVIPVGHRWSHRAFIDYAYLDRVLKTEKNELDGKIFFGILQLDDQESANRVSGIIEGQYPNLKVETMATAVGRFMAPLRDILWGVQYFLVPAILVVMTLILANTFSLTVRERQQEIAVLKVLGFRAWHILLLVLGESALVGLLAGMLGAVCTFGCVNLIKGGFQLEGFPLFLIPASIFWWGPLMGIATAFFGGVLPAFTARAVKVSVIFTNVA
jgi:putative ABC transport system permease protein